MRDRDSWSAHGLGFLLALIGGSLAPLMILTPRAPTGLAIIAAFSSGILLFRLRKWPKKPDRLMLSLLIGILAWAAISTAWAIVPGQALSGSLKLGGNIAMGLLMVAVGGTLNSRLARLVTCALSVGCGLAAAVIGLEMLTGAPLSARFIEPQFGRDIFAAQLEIYGAFWFNAAVSVLTLMVWPIVLTWRRLPVPYLGAMILAIAWLAVMVGFGSGMIALLGGTFGAVLVWKWRRAGSRLIAGLLAFCILIAPVLPLTVLDPERMSRLEDLVPTNDLPRLYIWAFASEHIADRPWLGWGMNASRNMPGGEERIVDHIRDKVFGEVMPLHPHNFALQAWLELGLIGTLLVVGLVVRLIFLSAASSRPSASAAAATGLALTALLQFALSYGAWQSWWLASVFLASTFLVVAERTEAN